MSTNSDDVNAVADAYRAFIEGFLGPDKTCLLDRKLESWRFLDFWRYGVLWRKHVEDLEKLEQSTTGRNAAHSQEGQ